MPNIPAPDVPIGKDDSENPIVRTWGEPKTFPFEPKAHWDIGEALDIIDFDRGVKLSGTRFYVLRGSGARLQRAVIAFMLDLHTTEHGYTEIYPPFMVKRECLVGAGNLPKFADNLYHDAEEDYWFVPTAEVPLTNLHRDEIIPPGQLPFHYVAYTACFRREKMSAGKDTRGIKRGHQFDKVEMYKFTEPEKSNAGAGEDGGTTPRMCASRLGLPYRITQLCTGDIGFGVGEDIRYRGVGAGLPGMAGGQLLLQLRGFPGAPHEHPLPPRRRTPNRSMCTPSTAPGWRCRAS